MVLPLQWRPCFYVSTPLMQLAESKQPPAQFRQAAKPNRVWYAVPRIRRAGCALASESEKTTVSKKVALRGLTVRRHAHSQVFFFLLFFTSTLQGTRASAWFAPFQNFRNFWTVI